jgi:mono/diheme cytochrome c family protein
MTCMKRYLIVFTLAALAAASCDRTRSTTGWDYMPDMYYSNAYESYAPNPNFGDGLTMREPVEGTVPRGMVPFAWEKTEEDRVAAGKALSNPLEPTPENIERGKEVYGIFCMQCHGPEGDGKGFLFTSKKYPYPPASLISEKVMALNDGEIYHTLTVGYGIMGAHGGMIRPADRWKIILYIHENLQNQTD